MRAVVFPQRVSGQTLSQPGPSTVEGALNFSVFPVYLNVLAFPQPVGCHIVSQC